jgi:hypothetical protein
MQMVKSVVLGASLLLCASLALAGDVRVKVSKANVRSQPSLSGKIVGKVARGDTLEVLASSQKWVKVNGAGVEGWIYGKLVEDVPEAPPSSASRADSDVAEESDADVDATTRRKRRRTPTDQKMVSFGAGASFANKDIGFGLDARVIVKPVRKLPNVRAVVALDYFLKEDRGWQATINGAYAFKLTNTPVRPYVGAGLVVSHAVGETATDFDVAAGAEWRDLVFLEGRLILSDATVLVVSAGVRF